MYLIALLVVFALLGVFAVQNGGTQDFSLLGYTWNLPTWAPTAIGTAIVAVLLMFHMSHAGIGARFREMGHGRTLDEHRGLIDELRTENGRLREELAAARGAASVSTRTPAADRSWMNDLRDLPSRVRNRTTA
jgi:uncharacterized integral membrane protein